MAALGGVVQHFITFPGCAIAVGAFCMLQRFDCKPWPTANEKHTGFSVTLGHGTDVALCT